MNTGLPPVLLVEDSDEDFEITVGALRLANMRHPILRCANGNDVEKLLGREAPFEHVLCPVLILLDLNLGGTNGRDLLARFRETEWLRTVPITILTTSSNPADIRKCYASHANTYLVKPVDLERFEIMIQNWITFWFDTASLPVGARGDRSAAFRY